MTMRWVVARVKGIEPERFLIIGLDFGVPHEKAFMKTGRPMTEVDMRKELEKTGISKAVLRCL